MIVTGFACPSDTNPVLANVPITLKKITNTSVDITIHGVGGWRLWCVIIGH